MANKLEYLLSLKDAFSSKLKTLNNGVTDADRKFSGLQSKLSGLGSAIAGAFAVGSIVSFGKAVFDSLRNYEYFSTALRTLMKGDALASKALEGQLIKLASTTPFELTEIQMATKQLMAYGVAGGDMTRTLRMLGDVSAGLGKESLPFIIRAFGQIKSKGHLAGQELNQLTEQGFNPLKIISEKTKVSYDSLLKKMADGKITFDMVEQSFKDVTQEGGQFFNMMEAQSKTVGGKWSNISDVWEQIKVNIGKSQTGILSSTMDWISKMANTMNKKLETGNFLDEALKKQGLKTGFFDKYFGAGDYKGLEKQANYMQQLIKLADNPIGAKSPLKLVDKQIEILQENYKKGWVSGDSYLKEMALYTETYKAIGGNMKLLLSKGFTVAVVTDELGLTKGSKTKGTTKLGTGTDIMSARPQSLVININELVHDLKLMSTTVNEGAMKIKEEIAKALLEAVNDVNYAIR